MPTWKNHQPTGKTPALTMVFERENKIANLSPKVFLLPFAHAMKF
jgi:hypothetical protein